MVSLGRLIDGTLSGGSGYYEYELDVGRRVVLPWLKSRMSLEGTAVGDFGCHAGGVLQAFRLDGGIALGRGFDTDARAIRESPFQAEPGFSLTVADIRDLADETFDLVILRDVLEHVPDRRGVLEACRRCLRPGGAVYVSFPPYYSPFGGHQQVSANLARLAPFVHLLPSAVFFSLLKFKDNEYLDATELRRDLKAIRSARLTIRSAEASFAEERFAIESRELFLLRPEYVVRYGFASLGAGPIARIPVAREVLVMGAFYLLRKRSND